MCHCLGSTTELIKEFKSLKLDEANAKYRNAKKDRHYFGLAKSLIIGVRRMCRFCEVADAIVGRSGSKRAAIGLLMALSLLHESLTPRDLFRLSPEQLREAWLTHQKRLAKWTSSAKGAGSSACVSVRVRVCVCPCVSVSVCVSARVNFFVCVFVCPCAQYDAELCL